MRLFGKELIGARNVVGLTMVSSKFGDSAACLVTQALHGFKIAQLANLNLRQVFYLMLASAYIAVLTCHPTSVHIIYTTPVPKNGLVDEGISSLVGERISGQVGTGLKGSDLSILPHGRWSPFHPLPRLDALAVFLVAIPSVGLRSEQCRPLVWRQVWFQYVPRLAHEGFGDVVRRH